MNFINLRSIRRSLVSRLILLSFLISCIPIGNIIVYGDMIESDSGSPDVLNQIFRNAYASGSGTASNFYDPLPGDAVPTVFGGNETDLGWVSISYDYYADGWDADDADDDGKMMAGVWATAQVSHAKTGEVEYNPYVYDGVSASSKLYFEFMMIPNEEGYIPQPIDSIPTNIAINLKMEVTGSEKEDMGRTHASILNI